VPIARKHLLPDPLFFRCIFSGPPPTSPHRESGLRRPGRRLSFRSRARPVLRAVSTDMEEFAIFLRPTEQICPDSAGPFIVSIPSLWCRKRPCLREINQHLPLFLCFGSKCPIQSLLGVFAELFGLGHCQNSYVGSVPPVLRSLGSMTEASLCKIAHPGLQCKIINRLSFLKGAHYRTGTAPTPPKSDPAVV
jgi:hypothetical protein